MLVLDHHGIEERPPGDRYWLNSAHRDPRGAWLLQQVLNGQIQVHADGAQRTLRAGDCSCCASAAKRATGGPPHYHRCARTLGITARHWH